eukprot:c20822_g1_i2 orf=709-948(+)
MALLFSVCAFLLWVPKRWPGGQVQPSQPALNTFHPAMHFMVKQPSVTHNLSILSLSACPLIGNFRQVPIKIHTLRITTS